MASRFDEDYLLGYTKYQRHFDKWAKKAECLLGEIAQCGFFELDKNGYAYIASNSPHIGEEWLATRGFAIESNWSYIKDFENTEFVVGGHYLDRDKKVYRDGFLFFWFTFRVIVNDVQRVYFFSSKSPLLHSALFNNASLFKRLIKEFMKDSDGISDFYQNHKVFMHGAKDNYFLESEVQKQTERQRANLLLQEIGVLDKKLFISPREWECLQLYSDGKSARKSAEILNISRRTVETHFNTLKEKLGVDTKLQIREIIE
ncbi:MAG: LuxR family transcriptional regulator [Legionellales bacterium]|nr:LuxR family transcriptional regulator [Legionellales bacterium]